MSVQVFCPNCDRSCRIKEEYLGRRVRCPGCREVFKAEDVPLAEMDDENTAISDFTPPSPLLPAPDVPEKLRGSKFCDTPSRPGKVENPFEGAAGAEAGPSAFDFEIDSDPPRKDASPKPSKSRRDEEEEEPDDESDARRSKPKAKETPAARRKEPEEPPRKHVRQPESDSPFAFGEGPPPQVSNSDAAEQFGFQDLAGDDLGEREPRPKARKSGRRRYFHARQSSLLGEARLFRVFVLDDELVFLTAAAGKDVAAVEEALADDSVDELERRLRNQLADLDELPIDELCEADHHSFGVSAGKVEAAAIGPPGRKLLRKTGSGTLVIEHKSKGEMTFDLPDDEDVQRAIDNLPDLLDDVLQINVRWDKVKQSFVAR